MMVVRLANLLLYALPSFFLLAVFCSTATEWLKARRQGKACNVGTEPVVLMLLGFTLLVFNARFVPIVANVAEQQMKAFPNLSAAFVGTAYGVTAVVLIASFAKAFWTHLNLDDGRWGPASNYREGFEKKPILALAEFVLRVLIALIVVVLQEQIGTVEKIDGIQRASPWQFNDDAAASIFIGHYDEWLARIAFWGMVFFFTILMWLALVYPQNRKREGSVWAFIGTATFAGPGFALSWFLNYLATGSGLPSLTVYGQPDTTQIVGASWLLIALALAIGINLLLTLWQARGVFRDLWCLWRENHERTLVT